MANLDLRLKVDLPVLIIAYSRPDGVARILQTLKSNQIDRIYIAIDGAKNLSDEINQKNIQAEIFNFQRETNKQIRVLKQKQNLGIAVAIIGAIDWFFANESQGIILEDDLIVSNDFFGFAFNALEIFKEVNDVWMISGTQLFPDLQETKKVIWTNYPMIWGWASWSKKWKEMRHLLLTKKVIKFSKLLDYQYLFWSIGANRVLSGKVDTWDTPLACEFRNKNKVCILPPVNLISNIGNDKVSTNTKRVEGGIGMKICLLDQRPVFTFEPNSFDIEKYNSFLELDIFKIKFRHLFLPYYALFFDWIRFPKSLRKEKLSKRIKMFES